MRTHRSYQGGTSRAIPGSGLRISDTPSTRAAQAARPATTTSPPNWQAPAEAAKNATVANVREAAHPVLLDAAAYATANAASPTRPNRIPTAACAAKCGPCYGQEQEDRPRSERQSHQKAADLRVSLLKTISGSIDDEVRRGSATLRSGHTGGSADGPANPSPTTDAFGVRCNSRRRPQEFGADGLRRRRRCDRGIRGGSSQSTSPHAHSAMVTEEPLGDHGCPWQQDAW